MRVEVGTTVYCFPPHTSQNTFTLAKRREALKWLYLRAMLMVIFGAGASYDSCPTYPPGSDVPTSDGLTRLNQHNRPPLASELFANRPLFAHMVERFPDCQPIVPRLRSLRDETLEAALEDLQTQAESYPQGLRELAAVRCYLHQIISSSENAWSEVVQGVTNYKSLLREIERTYPKEPVCLVTFNYDTLLEGALRQFNLPITNIDDYTKRHPFYRVFKLHGSTNWVREIETSVHVELGTDTQGVFTQLMEHLPEIRITDRYFFSPHDPVGITVHKPMFPAIAIPVEKKRSFECPAEMLEALAELLPSVSKLLVIGWRATEAHFLNMLGSRLTGLRPGVNLHVVAANDLEAEDIKVRICSALLNNPPSRPSIDPGGFTDFILSRRAEQFLGT